MTLKILYIHHAGDFGGASRSLMELLLSFPRGEVDPIVMCKKGQFLSILKSYKIKVFPVIGISQFDNTSYSHYKRFRWFILLRELIYLVPTIYALLKIKITIKNIDIIHLNEITLAPVALAAKIIFPCPIIAHVRSLQSTRPTFRDFILRKIYRYCISTFICIDQTVSNSLTSEFNRVVVHNGFSPSLIDYDKRCGAVFKVAMVGSFLKSKGCLEFIEAASILLKKYQDMRFYFHGNKPRKKNRILNPILLKMGISHSIYDEMVNRINFLEINNFIEINNFSENIDQIYQNIDLLVFPGYLDAPGRPVFEAGFHGVPSVLGIRNPDDDTFVDSVTGIKIEPGSVSELCAAIEYMYLNPKRRKIMGENAKILANKNFLAKDGAMKVISIYRGINLR